jgi:hypothetical protein
MSCMCGVQLWDVPRIRGGMRASATVPLGAVVDAAAVVKGWDSCSAHAPVSSSMLLLNAGGLARSRVIMLGPAAVQGVSLQQFMT